ncbi:MAG TPA: glycoside hydrolase family 2 TIM barrel-domain containing protein [Propionibacteriaceae bacterium]|nr:glycoside hydrolase family 2 TIM barrel-domain containing protein [Propionibacteriaceae bacterium]
MHEPAPDTMHPRPQLRRDWTDLSGEWSFAYDDTDRGRAEGWVDDPGAFPLRITVPFPPESRCSGLADQGFHPVVWYRRSFDCRPRAGARVLLHFAAVDYRATVWVNGQHVAEHEGGHTPFAADITTVLRHDGPQTVVVRAEDLPDDLGQPRGKQDWKLVPHAIWYSRTTGIWQPVWWEEVPERAIESVQWTSDPVAGTLALSARIGPPTLCDARAAGEAAGEALQLRVRASSRGEPLVEDTYLVRHDEVHRQLGLSQGRVLLGGDDVTWTPEHPNLIDTVLELLDQEGRVLDRVESYTALRSVRAEEGRFLLNGKPYFLRLVLDQGYWPDSHLAAPSEADLRREVELVKELGFNGVRMHQKAADPRFLAWCDRLGLLVWAEMPAAYEFSARTIHRLTREWLDLVERDRSHPCVIAWVPFNESWGVPALPTSADQRALVLGLYHLTKALDPARPVVGNDGWEQVVTDIVTVHDYSADGETLRERYGNKDAVRRTLAEVQPSYHSVVLPELPEARQPVMITEFGGITLISATRGEAWHGYGGEPDATAFLRRYRGLVDALLDSPSVTGFCYTQLTDIEQEQNGLLTDRREPKVPPDLLRAINQRTAASVPADAIGAFDFGDYPAPLDRRIDQDQREPAESG